MPRKSTKSVVAATPVPSTAPASPLPVAVSAPAGEPTGVEFLAIGDPHFKTSNVVQVEEFIRATLNLVQDRRPKFVVVLGDILDTHDRLNQIPLKMATRWLQQLSLLAPLYILIGNHDRMSDDDFMSDTHPLTALKNWANTTVVDQGAVIEEQGFRFVMLPYVYRGRLEEALQHTCTRFCSPISGGSLDAQSPEWVRQVLESSVAVFAHQEFRGAQIGALTSTKGDLWPRDRPVCISGHIHEYAWLQPNLVYPGVPFQHAATDRAEEKTVSWFRVVRSTEPWAPDPFAFDAPKEMLPLTCRSPFTVVEERERLALTPTVVQKTPAADFATTEPAADPETSFFSWHVVGTKSELVALQRLPKWKKWSRWIKQVRVRDATVLQTLPSDAVKVEKPLNRVDDTRSFVQVVHDEAQIAGLGRIFAEIFST